MADKLEEAQELYNVKVHRPKRAKLTPEESMRQMESFPDRKEQVVAGAAKPGLGDEHPLNDVMGTYEGPVWERIIKNIQRNRKEEDREALSESK